MYQALSFVIHISFEVIPIASFFIREQPKIIFSLKDHQEVEYILGH
jgi:hypothetical protein